MSDLMQRTLVLLKPDAVQRRLIGQLIARFEAKGLNIVAMKMLQVTPELAKQHYAEHVEKPFYKGLESLITLGPVLSMVIEGVEAIETIRKVVGPTEPKGAPAGTIRGDFAHVSYGYADAEGLGIKNLIHASANKEDAKKEVALWFEDSELHSYKNVHDVHILK